MTIAVACTLICGTGCSDNGPATRTTEPAGQTPTVVPETDSQAAEKPAAAAVDQQKTDETQFAADLKLPKIRFEKVLHDYCDVGPGSKNKCNFPFKNIGDGPLTIKVETTCGCTIANIPKASYEPGEAGDIEVEYTASTQPSTDRKAIIVHTNDPNNKRVDLVIKARVEQKVAVDPSRLKFLLKNDEPIYQQITLTSLDGQPFSIKKFYSTADCITAEIDPSVEATKFVLNARVDSRKLKDNVQGRIIISLTHPQCPDVSIFYDALPRFTVNPQTIIIMDAEPQKPIERKMWVLNNYNETFELGSIASEGIPVKLLGKSAIRGGYELTLEITPPAAEGKSTFSGAFTLNTKDGDKLPVSVRVFFGKTN
jgi:hypothetical protein